MSDGSNSDVLRGIAADMRRFDWVGWAEFTEQAAAELTRLRAEVETVLAGGREDRETIDALEGRVGELSEALGQLFRAADNMPRKTPAPGGASTNHRFNISAAAVWANDEACRRASAALAETKPVEHAKALGAEENT